MKNVPHFWFPSHKLKKAYSQGAAHILRTSTLPVRQVNPTAFPSPAAVMLAIHLHKPRKATFHPQFNLNPLPHKNAILGKRSSKGNNICRTSAHKVRGELRQLKSFQSFLRPKLQGLTEKRDGHQSDNHQQMPQCPGIMPVKLYNTGCVHQG